MVEEDCRLSLLTNVILLIRSDFRSLFGMEFTNQCGHFVDRYLSREIHSFADWIEYAKGDKTLKICTHQLYAAAFSSDGRYLYTGHNNGVIMVFDMITDEMIHEWRGHHSNIWCLWHNSNLLVSGDWGNFIHLWNTNDDYKLIRSFEGHTAAVISARLNRKNTRLLTGSVDKSVRLWSVKNGECLMIFKGHERATYSARFIDNEKLIISGSIDNSLRIWDPLKSDAIEIIQDPKTTKAINDVCINSDHTMIACLFRTGFSVLKWPEMETLFTYRFAAYYGNFHPQNPDALAVGDRIEKSICIYHVRNGECLKSYEGHTANIRDIHFSPDGCRMASVSEDRSIRVWDVSDI